MGLRGREGRRCKEEGRRDGEKEWRSKAVMDCISKGITYMYKQSTTLYGDAISHACVKKVQRSRERQGIRGHLL